MYSGLVKLVLVDPSIARPVLDLLLPHFLRFYKEVSVSNFSGKVNCVFLNYGPQYSAESLRVKPVRLTYFVEFHDSFNFYPA